MDDIDVDIDLNALARTGYTAYGQSTGWKNFQGNPMPAFDDLGPAIQTAWGAAAQAIAAETGSALLLRQKEWLRHL